MSTTADRDRLMQVAQALAKAAGALDGKRRLPVVAAADAAGLVAMMHEQLDTAIARRDADIEEAGIKLGCGRGCNACCALPVMIGDHEAVAVARWLAEPGAERAEVRERFVAAYQEWRGKLGGAVEAVTEAPDEETRQAACAAYFTHRAMCPFNSQGDCSIYEVRPALCRTTHAVGTNERCQDQSSTVPTISHPAVEGTYQGQSALRVALHASLRPGRGHDLLPKAVMRRLTKTSAFPNRPCPCGSGRKHKACCALD